VIFQLALPKLFVEHFCIIIIAFYYLLLLGNCLLLLWNIELFAMTVLGAENIENKTK
jgi:hypothetical protein